MVEPGGRALTESGAGGVRLDRSVRFLRVRAPAGRRPSPSPGGLRMFGRNIHAQDGGAALRQPRRVRRGARRRRQARRHLRPRRQVRQVVQRRRVQRRDAVHQGDRRRLPRPRDPERGAARAGPAQVRQGRLLADHDCRLRLGDRARRRSPPNSPTPSSASSTTSSTCPTSSRSCSRSTRARSSSA